MDALSGQHLLLRELVDLGLSQLEAEVYAVLVAHPSVTGYRVGQLLNKPTANVYKAIEALARKGALLVEEGDTRACRAVPPAEFLGHLAATYQAKASRVVNRLTNVAAPTTDEKVYQIQSAPLVFERAQRMIEEARRIVVVDAFPGALNPLLPHLEAASARELDVFVQVYQPTAVRGAQVAQVYQGEKVLAYWASQQLNVVVDGRELLVTLLSQDLTEVHQAVWSQSLYLSCILHAGMMREQIVHRLMELQGRDHALEQMRDVLFAQQFFHTSNVPGQQALLARYARPPEQATGRDEEIGTPSDRLVQD